MKRRYSVVLTPQRRVAVTRSDVPNLVTQGDTRKEALPMALDCAEALILTYMDHDGEVPEEGGRSEVATIEVDIDVLAAQLAAEKIAVGD